MARLKEWTGQPWIVAIEGGGGAESAYDREQRERLEARKEVEADPFVRAVMQAFPGAEIVEVRTIAAPVVEAQPIMTSEDEDQIPRTVRGSAAHLRPAHRPAIRGLVPQQLVDAGLRPRLGVHRLDDDGAGQAGLALMGAGQEAGHDDG